MTTGSIRQASANAPPTPLKPKCRVQSEKMNRPMTIEGTPVITSAKNPMNRDSTLFLPYSLR